MTARSVVRGQNADRDSRLMVALLGALDAAPTYLSRRADRSTVRWTALTRPGRPTQRHGLIAALTRVGLGVVTAAEAL